MGTKSSLGITWSRLRAIWACLMSITKSSKNHIILCLPYFQRVDSKSSLPNSVELFLTSYIISTQRIVILSRLLLEKHTRHTNWCCLMHYGIQTTISVTQHQATSKLSRQTSEKTSSKAPVEGQKLTKKNKIIINKLKREWK